ncbi:MAG TPA: lipid IV(A) 3-deoxy-D-manno-octulosonic acid transferase [Methylophilaceae bacterium]
MCENSTMPRLLYTLLIWLFLPFTLLRLMWRAKRQPEYLKHIGERLGFFSTSPTKPVIWLHCVSVGETRGAAPLVQRLLERYPDHTILITHGTPTGRATGEQLFGDDVLRCYLPYDLPFAARCFLRHYQPRLGLLMETELWFNLIHICRDQAIPLFLVNARLSEKSANSYALLGGLARRGLQQLTVIAAQTEQDAGRFYALSGQQVEVTGNIKFDVTPSAKAIATGMALRQTWGDGRPVFLAASTRVGEEELILDAVARLNVPGLLTVIVPRHPQRFDEVAAMLEKRGISYARRSDPLMASAMSVILGDSMGEMDAYYAACDVAFIGGSLLQYGGQNLIEACALGKPVVVGAHTYNFTESTMQAVESGAARRVHDTRELTNTLQVLMTDADQRKRMGEAGMVFAEVNRGATQRTLALIEKYCAKTLE